VKEETVRISLAVIVAMLLIPAAAATRPAAPSALTMKVSTHKVLYGHRVTLSGRVWGPNHAGRPVVLDAWPYGDSAPHRLTAVLTDPTGRWKFPASPRIRTVYQAVLGSTAGPRVAIGVAPAMSVQTTARGRLRVEVQSSRRFTGRVVQLQSRNTGGSWTTIARKRLDRRDVALFAPPAPDSTLRVAMSVNQAGAGFLGGASHAFVYRPQSLELSPSTLTVLSGHRVTFAGRVVNGRAGERVVITARRLGHPRAPFTTLTTGPGGRFAFAARPGILTAYQAYLGATQASPKVVVDVRPVITARELGNGHLFTRVTAGKSFRGRMVQLQRLAGGRWQTVAKKPLRSSSTAVFTLPLPTSLVRIAMSVNQAGAGSHPVSYHSL
jgi:hypothetical protein